METGKNILIIGGSGGIGSKITQLLSDEPVRLYLVSRSQQSGDSDNITAISADIARDDLSDKLPDMLNSVVYCPGSINLRPFHQYKDQDFLDDYNINVMGAVRVLRSALPALKKAEHPASVVLFSTVAVQTGLPYHASIAAAKGAIEGLTRSLAAEWAPRIRVNAIAPSITDTPMAARLLSTESKQNASAQRHPLKRYGKADDIADMAVYLLSDKASWITGQILHIDGGLSTLKPV